MLNFQPTSVKSCNLHFELSSSIGIAKLLTFSDTWKFLSNFFQLKFVSNLVSSLAQFRYANIQTFSELEKVFTKNFLVKNVGSFSVTLWHSNCADVQIYYNSLRTRQRTPEICLYAFLMLGRCYIELIADSAVLFLDTDRGPVYLLFSAAYEPFTCCTLLNDSVVGSQPIWQCGTFACYILLNAACFLACWQLGSLAVWNLALRP